MTDLSPAASTDSRGLTNANYGAAILRAEAQRQERRQAVERQGARDVVFHQRPRGEEQSVFDEFAHLESLYFGSAAAPPAAADDDDDDQARPKLGADAIVALPGQVGAAAAEGDVPHADEVTSIRNEVEFVQRQYLSQEHAERHRFAKYYTEDAEQERAERAKEKREVGDDASFEFRQRLAARVDDAGMDAEEFRDGLEMQGMPAGRAADIARLTQNVTKKVAYARDKETGMFKKYDGSGIDPPSEVELRIITRVIDHRAMDKRRVERTKDPNAVLEHTKWFHAADPIEEEDELELETLHMGDGGGGKAGKAGKGRDGTAAAQPPKGSERYILEKKPPPRAETPPNTDGRNMVCAFCGRHAPPIIHPRSTWHLQQYFDDETDRLVKDYFCENHNFARLLLRRPAVATHVKSHLWQDLREASTLDRQGKYCRQLCSRSWLAVAALLNIVAIMLAAYFLPLVAREQRCAALTYTTSYGPFSFNVTELDILRVESGRGVVTARVGSAEPEAEPWESSQATVTVTVSASSKRSLSIVEVSQFLHPLEDLGTATSAGESVGAVDQRVGIVSAMPAAVQDRADGGASLPLITLDDCYKVDVVVVLPPDLRNQTDRAAASGADGDRAIDQQFERDNGLSLAIHQRWKVSECTTTREEAPWPVSALPPRVVPECVIGRRVPIDAPVSMRLELPGIQLAAVDLSTNVRNGGGMIEVSDVETSVRMDVRATAGFTGRRLRTPQLSVYSLAGDIEVHSIDAPMPTHARTIPMPVRVWLTRGEGDRQNDVMDGALYSSDRGRIFANLTGLHHAVANEVGVHGADADVNLRMVETTAWSAALRSCGGQVSDIAERLEQPPVLEDLPLICQKFFDDRWEMCKRFAIDARARGDDHVTIDFAGNGFCEAELNLDPCYDGGDCCASTCNTRKYPHRCGILQNGSTGESIPDAGYNCTDHWAHENFGDLPDCGSIMLDQNDLYTAQMSVWNRPLMHYPGDVVGEDGRRVDSRESPTAAWAGGPRSKHPFNAGDAEAQMLPVPYTSVSGASKGWGWHTCAVALGEIFLPQRLRIGADSPLHPRSQLNVDVVKGDVELNLVEAVGYSDAWRRHQLNLEAGLDCSVWTCDDEDECASSPCQNGGSCAESDLNGVSTDGNSSVAVGWYNCTCTWGFCGTNCDYAKEYQKYRMIIDAAGAETEENPSSYFCMAEVWFQAAEELPQGQGQPTQQREFRLRGQSLMGSVTATLPSYRFNNTCQARSQDSPRQCLESYAFDGYAATAPCSADGSLPNALLFFDFDAPIHLLSYSIQAPARPANTLPYREESGRGPHTAPSTWRLEASRNGGSTWIVVDEQTDITWEPEQYRTFPLRTC
eukprot:COSAG02_NODE_2510_length_8629_cov_2.483236_3_plen_1353_part_00